MHRQISLPDTEQPSFIGRQALAQPELLSLIFSHCHRSDCAVSARVSRIWAAVALDEVWKDMTRLKPLLTLLDDVLTNEAGEMVGV